MPRRTLFFSFLAVVGSQLSSGCCWRPFACHWGGCAGPGPLVGGPVGCASCGSSPIAGGPIPTGPILTSPPMGYSVSSAAPIVPTGPGSVFTGAPTPSFPGPTVTKEVLPFPNR